MNLVLHYLLSLRVRPTLILSIENLFHIVKKKLDNQAIDDGIQQETWEQFTARVQKSILIIPITYINNLIKQA